MISRDFDHNPNHFRFERNTGLPRSTFERPRISRDGMVFVVAILAAIAAYLIA